MSDPCVTCAAPVLREGLADQGVRRRYPAHTILIHEGDFGDSIYLILEGRVRAFVSGDNGREVTLGVCGVGEYVGEMALDGGPRSASVETMEVTVCSVVSRDVLRAYIAEHPDFAFEMMARLIRRVRLATASARNLALIDVYGRLTRFLSQTAVEQPDGTCVMPERMTHQELSRHAVCSREMVSRVLKDLETGGYVALKDRRLVLLKSLPARW